MYFYLSILSSSLTFVGYFPEIYYLLKYKTAKPTNVPIWIIWVLSSSIGGIYCYLNADYLVMVNFIINFGFCFLSLMMNIYFIWESRQERKDSISSSFSDYTTMDWFHERLSQNAVK